MSFKDQAVVACILLFVVFMPGCKSSGEVSTTPTTANADTGTATAKKNTAPPAKSNADGTLPSGTGVEKEKPAPGTGNVQGKVFYNEKPAANIEVKLCETFSQYVSGCGGETFITKTDSAGEYLIKNVPPRIYEGLTVKVFDTKYYVFATSGIVQNAKYKIEDGKTFFAPDTHLFKQDLKLLSPKAGSKTAPSNIEVKWDAYPDAAYYKFSIYADSASGAKPEYDYINKRVDGLSYALDKPLSPGSYRCTVMAYNGNDIKLAESAGDITFTVTGDAAKDTAK
ncbi:MAG TPA: hypothetical protein VNA19_12110 [Pyrinomonadaceae bacterium]|jgi:hypothetical protein|nr:hypothetical protein [Pyrinomonadaceae bacterium]